MAVILYPSGVTETYEPSLDTFTDVELLKIFEDFISIRTARLYEVPNTWCVWGENPNPDSADFNKLGSDIVEENIFCPILFIHDTELDSSWMLTDEIILRSYNEFKNELLHFFDGVAENVIRENQKFKQGKNSKIKLNTLGPTEDKRVMFEFNPHQQSKDFYKEKYFTEFSRKVFSFLNDFYKDGDTFVIFADKKSIIAIADENVDFLINKIIKNFENREKYERCSDLKNKLDSWQKYKKDHPSQPNKKNKREE